MLTAFILSVAKKRGTCKTNNNNRKAKTMRRKKGLLNAEPDETKENVIWICFDGIVAWLICAIKLYAIQVCVWQLVSLIHAINYVMSLTDGTRDVGPRSKPTTHICLMSIWLFSNIMCEYSLVFRRNTFYTYPDTLCAIVHQNTYTLTTMLNLLLVLALFTSTSLSQHMRSSLRLK